MLCARASPRSHEGTGASGVFQQQSNGLRSGGLRPGTPPTSCQQPAGAPPAPSRTLQPASGRRHEPCRPAAVRLPPRPLDRSPPRAPCVRYPSTRHLSWCPASHKFAIKARDQKPSSAHTVLWYVQESRQQPLWDVGNEDTIGPRREFGFHLNRTDTCQLCFDCNEMVAGSSRVQRRVSCIRPVTKSRRNAYPHMAKDRLQSLIRIGSGLANQRVAPEPALHGGQRRPCMWRMSLLASIKEKVIVMATRFYTMLQSQISLMLPTKIAKDFHMLGLPGMQGSTTAACQQQTEASVSSSPFRVVAFK